MLCLLYDKYLPGKTWQQKTKEIQDEMATKDADALIVTSLDETACKCVAYDG